MQFIEGLKDKVNKYIDGLALKSLSNRVKIILKEREELKNWTDQELKLASLAFKDDLAKGKTLDSIAVHAFAVVNEAARRVLKQTPFDVQILAGLVLHMGKIAEMKAGEGKTLTETMPVYLNALEGKGAHIITTNDYLAERDAKANGKLFNFLGLSVGFVTQSMKNEARRKAYLSDITYVTNQEVGFDFLRDNLVFKRAERVLRKENPLHFGIVDEIDSILIDESRTPLIIAQPIKEERSFYDLFTKIVNQLEEDKDYEADYKHKQIKIKDQGLNRAEELLGEKVFSENNPMYVFYLDVCLQAKTLFEKDRDYIITNEGVEIVDEFTGRVLPGRRFTDGVHQAIEAKERVEVKESDRTVAAITFQNFFPMYKKLAGMSGTVMRARDEFAKVYKLDVVQIPTNRPCIRIDHHNLYFKTWKGKILGLLKKVEQIHKKEQPILIGARNVEAAHLVAQALESQNLPFQLLTAKDNREEAEKIARGGQPGMITVATNMAGRGTDILLGNGVAKAGGLFVIGTERHESRRIDDQLIGRAGRQGEEGESQFLISMEDEIMQLFGNEKIINAMEEYDIPEDEYIFGKGLDEAFKEAQNFVESKNFDSRIYLYKYDRVANFQRNELYKLRESLLENELGFEKFFNKSLKDVVNEIFVLKDLDLIAQALRSLFFVSINKDELKEILINDGKNVKEDKLLEVREKFFSYFNDRASRMKKNLEVWQACQSLILEVIDNAWGNHLELMDILKEEAGLFSYASEDPLIDFIQESRALFADLGKNIQKEFVKSIFRYLNHQGELE